uniref:Uncharacterized protein n=1 Tax=Anguilla anguilla TaxID=7936 RepID=A0A0E9SKH1_ANGAN
MYAIQMNTKPNSKRKDTMQSNLVCAYNKCM